MINLRTREARHREWLAKRRLSRSFVRALAPRLNAEFRRVGAKAAMAYRSDGSIDHALGDHPEQVQRILLSSLMATATAFGKRARAMVKKCSDFVLSLPQEIKDTEEELQASIAQFARDRARKSMAQVSNTTKARINKAIAKGISEGESRQDIADRIVDVTGGKIGDARAKVIAETEVHSASNAGELESIKGLDIPLKKEWLSMNDELVREDHQDTNGDEVDLDADFHVGGEELAYPGDPDASPAQTVNCRCVMVYNEPKKG